MTFFRGRREIKFPAHAFEALYALRRQAPEMPARSRVPTDFVCDLMWDTELHHYVEDLGLSSTGEAVDRCAIRYAKWITRRSGPKPRDVEPA